MNEANTVIVDDPSGPEDGIPPADVAAMQPAPLSEPESAIRGFGERLRGFEIVGTNPWDGSERLYAKFRPTEIAARQAASDLKWLQWRHPELKYELRALLSIGREPPAQPEQAAIKEPPLHLEADEPEVVAQAVEEVRE